MEALRRHANLMRVIETETRMMERFAAARPTVAQTQVQSLPTDVTDLAALRRVGALLVRQGLRARRHRLSRLLVRLADAGWSATR